MKFARVVVALGLALAAGILVVLSAAIAAWADRAPSIAARFWSSHPRVIIRQGLEQIGQSAVAQDPVTPSAITSIISAYRKSPLSPEPFLVRGVASQHETSSEKSLRALDAAVVRDPRSIAARYFLASYFVRSGDVDRGLEQMAVLARLVPRITPTLVPPLAKFAAMPGGAERVRAMLGDNPAIEPYLLDHLSVRSENAHLVMLLWNGRHDDQTPGDWREKLVQALVASGDVGRAHLVWARLARASVGPPSLVFNPQFDVTSAPPPFNWTYLSSGAGSAYPSAGRLTILYYGRENAVLAHQLLRLRPSRYRFSVTVNGGGKNPTGLSWVVECFGGSKSLVRIPLTVSEIAKEHSAVFVVPGDCSAQRLELRGIAPEFPDTVNATIAKLSLTRLGRD